MNHSINRISLNNGANGLLVDVDNADVFACRLAFESGHLFCPADKPEIAHFLEHTVVKNNNQYEDPVQFSAEFRKNGAYKNAYTSDNRIGYVFTGPNFEWERLMRLMTSAISCCLISEEFFEKEREVIREELTRRLVQYNQTLRRSIDKAMHGFDLFYSTRVRLLDNVGISDLENFYQATHHSANLKFIVAGKLKDKGGQIQQILETMSFPKEARQPIERYKYSFAKVDQPITVTERAVEDKMLFNIRFVRDVQSSLKERACLFIINVLLFYGEHSIINGQARAKGLNYGVYGGFYHYQQYSFFTIHSSVADKNAVEIFGVIVDGVKKILSGDISDQLIDDAKTYLRGKRSMAEKTCSRLAVSYASRFLEQDDFTRWDAEYEVLGEINKELIEKTFRSFFNDKKWYLGLLGSNVDQYKDEVYQIASGVFR